MLMEGNACILNEFDCPLLDLTTNIYCVDPRVIQSPVSIIHMCNESCRFITAPELTQIERELVSRDSKLTFVHDALNELFCVNIYCIP